MCHNNAAKGLNDGDKVLARAIGAAAGSSRHGAGLENIARWGHHGITRIASRDWGPPQLPIAGRRPLLGPLGGAGRLD